MLLGNISLLLMRPEKSSFTSKQKDVTRKQIVEQFAGEAKLSAAGANTYYS